MLRDLPPSAANPLDDGHFYASPEDHSEVMATEPTLQGLDVSEASATPHPRQLEISHTGQCDFILNHDAELAEQWGTRLKEVFQDGIPSSWQAIGGGGANVMMGEIDGKRFIAKLRNKRIDEGDTQMSDEEWAGTFGVSRKVAYAEESITQEMRLAPKIKAALDTDETQMTIWELGLGVNKVTLVEPILGVVSRSPDVDLPYARHLMDLGWHGPQADKFLVYEWVKGDRIDGDRGEALVGIIRDAMHRGGVQESDLRADQLLVSPEGNAYLLDTEEYMNLTPTSSSDARV